MTLSIEDEEKIYDIIKGKIENASKEELKEALDFFEAYKKKEYNWNIKDKEIKNDFDRNNNLVKVSDIKKFIQKVMKFIILGKKYIKKIV